MKKNLLLFVLIISQLPAFSQEAVNNEINDIIRKHGLEESEVMEIAGWMTDVYTIQEALLVAGIIFGVVGMSCLLVIRYK